MKNSRLLYLSAHQLTAYNWRSGELTSEGLAINLVWPKSRKALRKVSALLDALTAGLMPLAH